MKMRILYRCIGNEEGSAIVIALMVLVLLTFMGVAAMQQTNVEMAIVRNSAEYRRNFYHAESAIIEAAQIMENETNPKTELNPSLTNLYLAWIKDNSIDMTEPNNWVSDDAIPANNNSADATNLPLNSRYGVQALGIATGASLAMGATNLYAYNVYGMYRQTAGLDRGISLIEVEYRKRF